MYLQLIDPSRSSPKAQAHLLFPVLDETPGGRGTTEKDHEAAGGSRCRHVNSPSVSLLLSKPNTAQNHPFYGVMGFPLVPSSWSSVRWARSPVFLLRSVVSFRISLETIDGSVSGGGTTSTRKASRGRGLDRLGSSDWRERSDGRNQISTLTATTTTTRREGTVHKNRRTSLTYIARASHHRMEMENVRLAGKTDTSSSSSSSRPDGSATLSSDGALPLPSPRPLLLFYRSIPPGAHL